MSMVCHHSEFSPGSLSFGKIKNFGINYEALQYLEFQSCIPIGTHIPNWTYRFTQKWSTFYLLSIAFFDTFCYDIILASISARRHRFDACPFGGILWLSPYLLRRNMRRLEGCNQRPWWDRRWGFCWDAYNRHFWWAKSLLFFDFGMIWKPLLVMG